MMLSHRKGIQSTLYVQLCVVQLAHSSVLNSQQVVLIVGFLSDEQVWLRSQQYYLCLCLHCLGCLLNHPMPTPL